MLFLRYYSKPEELRQQQTKI